MIYLDYAATTPVDPRVAARMSQCLTPDGIYGNQASAHRTGQRAASAIQTARAQVAAAIDAEPEEIIFTSGATESTNLALKGATQLYNQKGRHLITLKTEHAATTETCQWLEKHGYSVTWLTPDTNGLIDPEIFRAAIRPDTLLASILHVNNETGVVQDIAALAEITAASHILLHVDAAQTIGKLRFSCKEIRADLISLCAHKVYGPKGIGALYVRRKPRIRVAAQIHGGGQEQGMRSGTLPTHQIVGMGEAFALASAELENDFRHATASCAIFLDTLVANSPPDFHINSNPANATQKIPHILNLCFPGLRADRLLMSLPEIALSRGSTCHTRESGPSHVLRAMGLSIEAALCSARISFGRFTSLEEVKNAALQIRAVQKLSAPRGEL